MCVTSAGFGDDDFGRQGIESLQREGIDVSSVVTVPGVTSRFAVILVDRIAGHRTVIWNLDPALRMAPEDVPDTATDDSRVMLFNSQEPVPLALVAERARRAGTRTVVDVERVRPGVDRLLRAIDVVIAADGFPEAYTGKRGRGAALAAMQDDCGAAIVCVTLGEEGSLARAGGREVRTPAFPVAVVDTTGAGDVFRAGFIAGWLAGGSDAELEEVLRWANAMAGAQVPRPRGPRGQPDPRGSARPPDRAHVTFRSGLRSKQSRPCHAGSRCLPPPLAAGRPRR